MYFTSAALSKAISNFLCSPINVLKTRYEVVGDESPKIYQAIKTIYQKEGILGTIQK